MQTFSDIIKSRAQPIEKKGRFKVQKVDEDKRLVFGWANVSVDVGGNEVVDLQEDMIDPEAGQEYLERKGIPENFRW